MHNPDTGLTWTFDDFPGPVPQDVPDRWWPPRPRKRSGGRGRHRMTGVVVGEETRHGSRVRVPVPLAVFPGVKTKGNTMTIEATDIDRRVALLKVQVKVLIAMVSSMGRGVSRALDVLGLDHWAARTDLDEAA